MIKLKKAKENKKLKKSNFEFIFKKEKIAFLSLISAFLFGQIFAFYVLNQKVNLLLKNIINTEKTVSILNDKIVKLELDLSNLHENTVNLPLSTENLIVPDFDIYSLLTIENGVYVFGGAIVVFSVYLFLNAFVCACIVTAFTPSSGQSSNNLDNVINSQDLQFPVSDRVERLYDSEELAQLTASALEAIKHIDWSM